MVDRSKLEGSLVVLDEGEYGTVYTVDPRGYTMRNGLPLAYKEFKQGSAYSHAATAVENAVELRDRIARQDDSVRIAIDRYFAWPWEIVRRQTGPRSQEVCGFLMQRAPEDFFWRTGRVAGQVRTLDWLASPESFWERNGIEAEMSAVTLADRLLLMTHLALAFAVLHRQNWVVGDCSFKNAAFALDPPRVMLFDCDDAASLFDGGRKQPHTPLWVPPECAGTEAHRQQDHETDVYKLGLAIVRCLNPAKGATSTREPRRLAGILDAPGVDLITRAVSESPDLRPKAREIFDYLKEFTDKMISLPVIEDIKLITPVVLRGKDGHANGMVSWRITNADSVRILLGEGLPTAARTVTVGAHPDEYVFPVDRSGQVSVEATNSYGGRRCIAGEIIIFEMPPVTVNFSEMPRPDIPMPPQVPVDAAGVAFPGGVPLMPVIPDDSIPRMAAPDIQVPAAGLLGFEDLPRTLTPDGMDMPSPSGISDTLNDGVQSQVEQIRAENDRFDALLREKMPGWQRKNTEADDGQELSTPMARTSGWQ
jgi:hypothetical protein